MTSIPGFERRICSVATLFLLHATWKIELPESRFLATSGRGSARSSRSSLRSSFSSDILKSWWWFVFLWARPEGVVSRARVRSSSIQDAEGGLVPEWLQKGNVPNPTFQMASQHQQTVKGSKQASNLLSTRKDVIVRRSPRPSLWLSSRRSWPQGGLDPVPRFLRRAMAAGERSRSSFFFKDSLCLAAVQIQDKLFDQVSLGMLEHSGHFLFSFLFSLLGFSLSFFLSFLCILLHFFFFFFFSVGDRQWACFGHWVCFYWCFFWRWWQGLSHFFFLENFLLSSSFLSFSFFWCPSFFLSSSFFFSSFLLSAFFFSSFLLSSFFSLLLSSRSRNLGTMKTGRPKKNRT